MLWDYITISTIVILAIISPGPDFALVTQNSLLHSKRAGFWTGVGIGCGNIIHVTYSVLGLAIIIANSAMAFTILKLLGAGYLLYLGVSAFLSKKQGPVDQDNEHIKHADHAEEGGFVGLPIETLSVQKAFWQGFLCNALNPKATLMFLSVFTVFISEDTPLWFQFSIGLEALVFCFVWFTFVAFFLSLPRVKKAFRNIMRYIGKVTGVFFIFFAIALAMSRR